MAAASSNRPPSSAKLSCDQYAADLPAQVGEAPSLAKPPLLLCVWDEAPAEQASIVIPLKELAEWSGRTADVDTFIDDLRKEFEFPYKEFSCIEFQIPCSYEVKIP